VRVGFTGTRAGMTDRQKAVLKTRLRSYLPTEFHHGDAIGSDAEAHDIVWQLLYEEGMQIQIHIWPPLNPTKRAFKGLDEAGFPEPFTVHHIADDYIVRDHHIVNNTDLLIVGPKSDREIIRSGTWATKRYAIQKHKRVDIIYPSGETEVIYVPNG